MTANRNQSESNKQKRRRGRPEKLVMPDPIPDTPENVARALMRSPPKKEDEWRYLKPGSRARK